MRRFLAWTIAVLVLPAWPAWAQLGVGDTAPPLSILEWVKGAPVDLTRTPLKRIHVVEFWAVWCPPCKMSVPLLTELQEKYKKEVVIVGVTEPDAGRNSPAAIRRFVKQQGKTMEYTVAIDTGITTSAYMAAAGAIGIPHAFIVDRNGKIAWQGSPLEPALGEVLEQLVAGTFDVKAAKVEREVGMRFQQLDMMAQMGQWRKVWDGLVDILRLDPTNEFAMDLLRNIGIEELKDADAFPDWARLHVSAHRKNAKAMRALAESLWSIGDLKARYPALVLEAAKAAYDASEQREAKAISTYARALYEIGDLDRAIALQQDAVAVAVETEQEDIRDVLDYYRSCKKLQQALP